MQAPDAEEDKKNIPVNNTGIKYIQSDTSESVSYFVRDDGCVDATYRGGNIEKQFIPPQKTKYIAASAGNLASYLLRDDITTSRKMRDFILESAMLSSSLISALGHPWKSKFLPRFLPK